MSDFRDEVAQTQAWFDSRRFDGLKRLYTARQVVEQRGTIRKAYAVARDSAEAFYERLRDLFGERKSVTTFGPYSPGQAVAMKRMGIDAIYLGGWATSAKGSVDEDPGPDLASYPLSQVPNEAAVLVRALLTADKNQQYARARMSEEQRAATPAIDFRPFIIADADTGHGGDPHVRNLVRRFVEVGVPGYHIEDQRPGTKKCGHQGGKVLVSCDEQIKRLNAARFQLDVMCVGGLIVARTDAESAALLDGRGDERDQPFLLGATNLGVPAYKACYLALLKALADAGLREVNGYELYALCQEEYAEATAWLEHAGLQDPIQQSVAAYQDGTHLTVGAAVEAVAGLLMAAWEAEAGLETFSDAVADGMEFRAGEGEELAMRVEAWREGFGNASLFAARRKATELGVHVDWDCDLARTPEGFYQIRGGIAYAIAKSLAAAPFCDILWMETKTAKLEDAKIFADAIHARFPDKMLAYNLSPSFSWDTTGMDDDQMRDFPRRLGEMGFVFNFITYGGHQIDGVASEEFSTALQQDGMLALARIQRKLRLVESPYRTPQTLVGGPRLDGALTASSGRTATTRAMGRGSTQFQHLVQTEVPKSLLEEWLGLWTEYYSLRHKLTVQLRPHRAGSELLELSVMSGSDKEANVIFAPIQDRRGRNILSVRDQNTFDETLRKKRLMTLLHLFLIHRYKTVSVHYVTPTEDNRYQTAKMKAHGLYAEVADEIGDMIVADVDQTKVGRLLEPEREVLMALITKADKR